MMRLSANISTMFIEYASLDRLAAGFCAMEMQFPYELDLGALEAAPRQPGTGQINWPAFLRQRRSCHTRAGPAAKNTT